MFYAFIFLLTISSVCLICYFRVVWFESILEKMQHLVNCGTNFDRELKILRGNVKLLVLTALLYLVVWFKGIRSCIYPFQRILTSLQQTTFENIVVKGEIAHHEQFHIWIHVRCPQVILPQIIWPQFFDHK